MNEALSRFIKEESGATAIEYGLIAAGIAVAIMTSISMVSCSLKNLFTGVADRIKAS